MSWPKHFDSNEWFVIGTSLFMILIFLLLPRRFSICQILVLFVFNFFTATSGDTVFAGPPYNLYDVMDRPKFGVMDLVLYFFDYPIVAYVSVYFFDKWHVKGIRLFLYLLVWAILTVILERISAFFHVFTYRGWNLFDSLLVYFIAYALNVVIFLFTKRYTLQKYF